MSNPYPAGTVAMVTAANRREEYRAFFDGQTWRELACDAFCVDSPLTVRPLIMLDLDSADVLKIVAHLKGCRDCRTSDRWCYSVGDAIEAQTRPAIEEPKGLGAVVEDADGHKYVRVADPIDGWMAGRDWQRIGGEINTVRNFGWSNLNPVRVLAEGVTA